MDQTSTWSARFRGWICLTAAPRGVGIPATTFRKTGVHVFDMRQWFITAILRF
jgi:hypothetical protein